MSTPETLFTAPRPPFIMRIMALIATSIALVISRFRPIWIKRILLVIRGNASEASYEQSDMARDAVIAVSTICAGKGCLPRSIAAAILCRFRGVWPTWQVGVRTSPFGAHAWIEAEGLKVGENDTIHALRPILTVAPTARKSQKGVSK